MSLNSATLRLPEHPSPICLCLLEHSRLHVTIAHPGQRYFAATPASHTAQSPRRSRAAVAGAVSTAAASVSVSAIARTCVAAVTIQQMRPATF